MSDKNFYGGIEKMEKITLKAEIRTEIGKGGARKLRREGMLPAVMYSKGNSTPVKVNFKEINRIISSKKTEHAMINIELHEGNGKSTEHPVLIKDYQLDPVTDRLLHVDFQEVSLEEEVEVTVPIEIVKQPQGVKMGGILEFHLREVDIMCLPTNIPEKIEIDASAVGIGHSFHVSDIVPPEGIRIVTDPEEVVLTVTAPRVEEAPEEAEEAEPEVIKAKGKEEKEKEKEEEKEEKE